MGTIDDFLKQNETQSRLVGNRMLNTTNKQHETSTLSVSSTSIPNNCFTYTHYHPSSIPKIHKTSDQHRSMPTPDSINTFRPPHPNSIHTQSEREREKDELLHHPQHKIHHDGRQKRHSENGRSEAIINATLAAFANTLRAPVECDQRIDHGGHGDDGEQTGGDAADAVTEVQESDG